MNKGINLRVIINAGEAKPAAPLGPILGQYQINMMQFCQEFNAKTQNLVEGVPLLVNIIRYENKSYLMEIKRPSISFLLDQVVKDKCILAEHLFDVIKLHCYFTQEPLISSTYTVLGSVASKKLKIIF